VSRTAPRATTDSFSTHSDSVRCKQRFATSGGSSPENLVVLYFTPNTAEHDGLYLFGHQG